MRKVRRIWGKELGCLMSNECNEFVERAANRRVVFLQARAASTNWVACSSTGVLSLIISGSRSSNWLRAVCVRASSHVNFGCPTVASVRSSTVTRRRAPSAPVLSAVVNRELPLPLWRAASHIIAARILASSVGRFATSTSLQLIKLNCV